MPTKTEPPEELRPAQSQSRQPGQESVMKPRPVSERSEPVGGRLHGKVALVSGGDSGIGRAVALAFAREGAEVAIGYLESEEKDARETVERIRGHGRNALPLPGDVAHTVCCAAHIAAVRSAFGRLDILVNNAAEQHPQERLEDIADPQLERTFATNIFSYFRLTRAALALLGAGGAIINTTSVTAYRGSAHLIDYAATKAAIVGFTRSLALALVKRGIRVNAVAPGPVWTPLIPASFEPEKVATFGSEVPLGRAGEPAEIAPAYVFLACDDASYMTGQVLHPNGGEIING